MAAKTVEQEILVNVLEEEFLRYVVDTAERDHKMDRNAVLDIIKDFEKQGLLTAFKLAGNEEEDQQNIKLAGLSVADVNEDPWQICLLSTDKTMPHLQRLTSK